MTTICIHQPDFAPWLGFFDRLADADIYVVLDDVQFLRRAWHHRDRILGPEGSQWLTVPVLKKGRYSQEIRAVEIDESEDWRRRHLRTLEVVYGRRPGFADTQARLADIYQRNHTRLIDLNLEIIDWLMESFDVEVEVVMSSDLKVTSTSTQRLVDITTALGGDCYLTGTGSRDYLDTELFERSGIKLHWQNFTHPTWDQGRDPFVPGLSSLDALYHGASPTMMFDREEGGINVS